MKIKNIASVIFCYLFICGQVIAQNAALLPQGKQQFLDNNGNPLSSGKVDFYIPSTTTRKTTWQDAAKTVANANPVVLDAGGRAIIYGDGTYRQVVKNSANSTIFDAVTASAGTGGGTIGTGDGDLVGTVKPWAGLVAPNQYVFAYGQEISRATYAAFFTAVTLNQTFACTSASPTLTGLSDTTQIPIGAVLETTCVPAGSTVSSKTSTTVVMNNNASLTTNTNGVFFLYGNGNGSTTFNVPDLRGEVIAGRDNMGGVAANRLTTTFFGTTSPQSTGGRGGLESRAIVTANLPPYTPSGTIGAITPAGTVSAPTITVNNGTNVTTGSVFGAGAGTTGGTNVNITATSSVPIFSGTPVTPVFTGTAQGGGGAPIPFIQPTLTLNYIVKITPDQNSADASGVTSLGLMTGDIACGVGLSCTGNVISVGGGGSADAGTVLTGINLSSPAYLAGELNVKAYGATGNGIKRTDGVATASSVVFTSASANFVSADIGKLIVIDQAGALATIGMPRAPHATTIASLNSSTSINLTVAAVASKSSATYQYGTDDTTAIQGAINSSYGSVYFPTGRYLVGAAGLTGTSNKIWKGDGTSSVITAGAKPTTNFIIFSVKNNIKLDKLSFDGFELLYAFTSGSFPTILPIIYFLSGNNITIQNSEFIGWDTAAILTNTAYDIKILSNTITRSQSSAGHISGGTTGADGAMTAASNILTSATANFQPGDVGKMLIIEGAGIAGGPLTADIIGRSSTTSITLGRNAITTTSAARYTYQSASITPISVSGIEMAGTGTVDGNELRNFIVDGNTITNGSIYVSGHDGVVSNNLISHYGFGAGILGGSPFASNFNINVTGNVISNGFLSQDTASAVPTGIEHHAPNSTINNNIVNAAAATGISTFGKNSVIVNNVTYNNGQANTYRIGAAAGFAGIGSFYDDATFNASGALITGNKAFDNQTPKTQEYGYTENSLLGVGCPGACQGSDINLVGNDFGGNLTADVLLQPISRNSNMSSLVTISGSSGFIGGSFVGLTNFSINNSSGFTTELIMGGVNTANRVLTINPVNANRTLTMTGNISVAADFITGGQVVFSGASAATFNISGTTNLTFPTGGTLTTTSNNLSVFAATTSAQLAGVISDETGSGSLVFATNPALVGGSHQSLTTLSVADPSGFNLGFISSGSPAFTANRNLTVNLANGDRTLTMSGNINVASGFSTLGSIQLPAVAQGDIWYGSATGVISGLAGVATGNALISGGVGVAPSWGKIGLTTHVSGITPIANGGTNASSASGTALDNISGFSSTGIMSRTGAGTYTFSTLTALMDSGICSTQGDIIYRSATVWSCLATDTAGKVLSTNGAGANPSWISAGGTGTVTNVATAGLATGGPITTTGTITVTAATQANQEAATSTTTAVTPSVMQYHPGVAKAWCSWVGATAGTNTCTSSYNVTNVTRISTGIYNVNLTTAFSSSTAYVCSWGAATAGGGYATAVFDSSVNSASLIRILYLNSSFAAIDPTNGWISCVGDQ